MRLNSGERGLERLFGSLKTTLRNISVLLTLKCIKRVAAQQLFVLYFRGLINEMFVFSVKENVDCEG